MRTEDSRKLELRAELARQDMSHRDLVARVRERGIDVEISDIARIIAGRWEPPADLRQVVAEILGRPSFELFSSGVTRR